MSRAHGIVADAVAAVIAGAVHTELTSGGEELRVTNDEIQQAARAAVEQLRADGWHITVLPPT
jgi:hypothetical protein